MTEREDSLGFQLLMSTLNNYNQRIKDLEDNEKRLRQAVQVTINGSLLLKQMIEIQSERLEIQKQRIRAIESRQLSRYLLR